MALLFASSEPRVKGCAAYAPVYDMNARFDATKRTMISRVVPSGARFFNELNPANLSQGLNGPVFLFQALDDTNVVPAMNDNAANQLLEGEEGHLCQGDKRRALSIDDLGRDPSSDRMAEGIAGVG